MEEKLWWKSPLRVIQTNLQVKDTPKMIPSKIAGEIAEMAGNVLVMNVGGIYAWYRSQIPYHHVNEYLPKDRDLLKEIIDECHARGVRVVARFDFSKTDDSVYQEKPQWFVREPDHTPRAYGLHRPGNWSILYSTCINAGYRNEELAVPVLEEVLDRYEIDGIFLNAPHYEYCCCDLCREKYLKTYGKPLPVVPAEEWAGRVEPDWASRCVKDNIEKLYAAVKKKKPEIPFILYYQLYQDNLFDRTATADMICVEPQDVLSLGWQRIPQFWKPALSIKMGRTVGGDYPRPFGIIHSCPGMDWRHTGLPTAEYMFWMSQVPANGGQIWHSITGFNDTISDKRILRSVGRMNHMIEKTERYMDGAVSASETLLIWNSGRSGEGWAEGLINTQTLFDVLAGYQITPEKLRRYRAVIFPEGCDYPEALVKILKEYVSEGGSLIVEGTSAEKLAPVAELCGVEGRMSESESLAASYLRFEENCGKLRDGFEETPLLAHRGVVSYCRPLSGTKVLATLVPPFAPLDAVGAPPERASILTPKTDLPLCTLREFGKGRVLFLPFQLSMLARTFKLCEHYRLIKNCVGCVCGTPQLLTMESVNGLQAMAYRNGRFLLVHFVNGIGQRPLANNIPYHGLEFTIRLKDGEHVKSVRTGISSNRLDYHVAGSRLICRLDRLDVWEMVIIEKERTDPSAGREEEGCVRHELVDG